MARDSFNEQKNKNVYSTKKNKKKKGTKTVVKKPQSSSVSKETTQQQRINQKTYGQPTKPAYKNNKAKTAQKQQTVENNTRPTQTVARQSRERTADTSREMMAQRSNATTTAAQRQKMGVQTKADEQAARDRRRQLGNSIKSSVRDSMSEDNRSFAQRQKSGTMTAQDEERVKKASERRKEVARNTGAAAKKAVQDTVSGYGQTLADVDEMAKSNRNWTTAKAQKMGIDLNDRARVSKVEQERQQSIREAREFRQELFDKQEQRQAEWDERTKNAKGLEKAWYGAVESGTGMLLDTAVGAATGTGQFGSLASMGLRTYGPSANQARKEGATDKEARLYGLASAGKEVGTELMFQGAGLAKAAYGKTGLSLADKSANILTKGLTGLKADAVGAGVRALGGTAEENVEELAGWMVDPVIKELTYGKNVRNRMKENLRANIPQIGSDADAANVASYFSTPQFTDELTSEYVKSGLSKEQASELAAEMRDYYVAYYSGDNAKLDALETDLAAKLSGQDKLSTKSWSMDELKDTFASTTLLTLATGIPGAVNTSVKGNRIFDSDEVKAVFGDDAVKKVADAVKNTSDKEMSLKAETMKDRLDSGKDLTGTQKYDLYQGYLDKVNETAKKAKASYGVVENAREEQDLVPTMGRDMTGNTVYAKATQREFNEKFASTELTVEALKNYMESDNSISDDEARRANAVKKAVADIHVGGLTVGDAHEFAYGNTLAREALKAEEGIDLDQYIVRNADGTVDLAATNEATENALFQMNADNAIKAAQVETEVFKDDYRGDIDRDVMSRFGNNGQAIWKEVNKSLDPRDLQNYLTTANAASYFYSAGRNTDMGVDEAVNRYADTFKTVDNSVLKRAFAAGARDRIIANTPGYGQTVEAGSNIQLKKTKPILTGQLIMDKDVVIPDSDQSAYLALAMSTNTNIHIVSSLKSKQGVEINGMSHGNDIYLNVDAAAEANLGYVFMHEMTHQIKQYAPNEYLALENLVRDRWFNKDQKGMQKAIKDRIDLYSTKGGQQLTEEEAVEEIIADAMAEAMDDPDFAAQVCEENINLGQAILNSIREALRSIRNMFANNEFRNEQFHNSLLSYLGILDEAEKMWLNALATAKQNKADGLIADWQDRANKQNSPRLSVSDEEIERIKAKKRTNKKDREILRDAGEKLKENDFYNLYTAHIINLGGKGKNADQMVESIKENGFKGSGGFGVNLVDSSINNISRQTEDEIRADLAQYGISEESIEAKIDQLKGITTGPNRWIDGTYYEGINITVDRYGGRKGQTVMFVPEHHTTNDRSLVETGFKPFDYEVVKVEQDFQPYYELYSKAYDEAHESRYSITPQQDADYMKAVESNDMDTAQRMVDEAAEKAMPNTKLKGRWYHGTENEFTVFNFSQGGKNGTADGYGIYLTNDPKVAESYGQRMIEGYVNVERPASALADQTLTDIELHRLISRTVDVEAETLMYDEGYDNAGDAKKDTWISNYTNTHEAKSLDDAIDDVVKTITQFNGNDFDIIQEIMNGMGIRDYEQATAFYDILTEETGIDGFETKWGDESEMADPNTPTIALAFRSEQIKDASPVTYDDDGKPIPLSDRFDMSNGDIRFSLTPEQQQRDADYMAAVNSGNMDEAQRLVDEAAKAAGYKTPRLYHGTPNFGFTVFDGTGFRDHDGWFFSDRKDAAESYAYGDEAGTYSVYLNLENPLVIDADGQDWTNIQTYTSLEARDRAKEIDARLDEIRDAWRNGTDNGEYDRLLDELDELDSESSSGDTDSWVELAKENGHDGLIIKNIIDYGASYEGEEYEPFTEYIAFNQEQIKSADPVTYAEDGSVIPLSERFDPSNNDIRYSLPTQDSDGNILTDGQMDYFKNSQARDAEGKMQVVYHTTNMGGFTIFDPSYSDDKRSLFFASNWNVSQTYGRNANKPIDIYNDINSASANTLIDRVNNTTAWNIDRIATEEDFKNEIKRVTLSDDDAKKYGLSKDRVEKSKEYVRTLKDMLERMRSGEDFFYSEYNSIGHSYGANSLIATKQEVIDLIQSYGKGTQGYYSCYLNLENPLIVDAEGSVWNSIAYKHTDNEDARIRVDSVRVLNNDESSLLSIVGEKYNSETGKWEKFSESKWAYFKSGTKWEDRADDISAFLKEQGLSQEYIEYLYDEETNYAMNVVFDGSHYLDANGVLLENEGGRYSTRELARIAEEGGHDGVIIKNLEDIGGASKLRGNNYYSDIYIAFSSNQIKDIHNENPTENPDIRYSITPDEDAKSQIAYDDAMDNSYELLAYYEQQLGSVNPETYDVSKAFREEDVVRFLDALKAEDSVPSDDPKFEEDRVRMAKSKEEFYNNVNAKWNDRWITEGEVLKISSVKRDITNLAKGAMSNSDTDAQYRNAIVRKTLVDARLAYQLMKQDRTELASYILYHSAQRMIEGLEFIQDDTAFEEYKGIRNFLRGYRINAPEEYWQNVEFQDFRKEFYGRLRIGKGTNNIEDVYKDCQDRWPHLFNEAEREKAGLGDSVEDLLQHIGVVVDSNVTPFYEAYSSEEAASLAYDIADQLYEIIANGDREVSLADSYKERFDEKTKAMKQRHAEAILRERKIREEGIKKERLKFREYKEAQKEKALHSKHFDSIKKKYDELTKRLLTNTKDKHIPEQYKKELAELLKAFDFQTVGSKKREARTGYKAKNTIKLEAMRTALERIEANSQLFHINDSVTDIMKDLLGLNEASMNKESVEGKTLDELSAAELKKIDKLLGALLHEFNNYEKVKVGVKKRQAADIGHSQNDISLEHADAIGEGKDYQTPFLQSIDRIINLDMMTPAYLFRKIDPNNEGLGLMWKEIRRSFDKYVENTNQLNEWIEEIVGKYHEKGILWNKYGAGELSDWRSAKFATTFNLTHGTIQLTTAQMMSVACLANRQQAYDHMVGAGVVVAPVSFQAKITSDIKKKINKSVSLKLTDADIKTIVAALTPEQRQVANKLQELMATKMAAWGNEASMNVLGIRLFEDPNYFPIRSDRKGLTKDLDPNQFEQAIRNFGFAKAVQPGARNAIMIDDIFDVVTEHCNNMNLYNSYTEAMNDFMKVYNYKEVREDGEYTVEQALSHAFSEKAPIFIMQFMRDLNGNVSGRASGIESLYNALLANAKKASVFANFRVAAQQPTAISRAFYVIDEKYIKGIKVDKDSMTEMFEHCPIALWKSWGYYDINMGKSIEDVIMNNGRWIEDKATDLYGKLDNVTWTAIWQMVKAETKDLHPELTEGSDEYWEHCNERMSEIVDLTQVVDSPMHRSHAMRDKGFFKKMTTAFMAEPTLTLNMLRDGVSRTREAYKRGKTKLASKIITRTIGVYLLQSVMVAGAQSIVDALRGKNPDKDDDDDRFLHLWWVNFVEDWKDEFNPLGKIYVVKDIKSMMDGWESRNLALQGVYYLQLGYRQLEGDPYARSSKGWYENMLYGLGYLTGVPIKTMMTGVSNAFKLAHIDTPILDEYAEYLDNIAKDKDDSESKTSASMLAAIVFDESMDAIAKKMGYQKAGSSSDNVAPEATSKESKSDKDESADAQADIEQKVADYRESLSDNFTDEEKDELVKQYEKRIKKGVKSEEVSDRDKDTMLFDAEKAAAGYEGTERDKRIWQSVSQGYKSHVESGDYAYIARMRSVVEQAGGNLDYFDEQIVKASKTALKKTIEPGGADTESEMVAQQNIRYYLQGHGVTQEEISSEIVYKCAAAKDLKVAFRINDEQAITESSYPLLFAGLTTTDYEKIYTNRNRMDLSKYDGKYKDRLKSTGTFVWPTQGTITSHFGARNAPTRGASSNHPAIDIGAPKGTPVVAADGGVVIYAGTNGGYGNSVGIKHDNGMVTYYNHLSAWNVNVGDTVGQGQQIANVGSTGISTGPHLDFKILDTNGKPVDPEMYLNKRS